MAEFEPDRILAINANESEFVVDLRPRLRQHFVFESAMDILQDFSSERVEKADLHTYWLEHDQPIKDLNEEVRKAGLIGRQATIEGQDVIVPNITIDMVRDITKVAKADDDKRVETSLKTSLNPFAIKGSFKGFIMRFKEVSDEDVYVPTINYRVSAGQYYTPNTDVTVYATGNVGTTMIDFEADVKLDELKGILEALYWLAPEAAKHINHLNMALSSPQLDATSMGLVSLHASRIINEIHVDSLRVAVEDAISDLVRHYIDSMAVYNIVSAIVITSQSAIEQNKKTLSTSYTQPHSYTQKVKDVDFMNELDHTKDGAKPTGARSLHVVLADTNEVDYKYIALDNLIEFTKR